MRLYVNDSFFSFFAECCALVYNRVQKRYLSVGYFGRKFHSQWSSRVKLVYLFCEFEEIYHVWFIYVP